MEANLFELENLKFYCNKNLELIANGELQVEDDNNVIIRHINLNCDFGYSMIGEYFWWENSFYVITDDKLLIDFRNDYPIDCDNRLKMIRIRGMFLIKVLFAGIYTRFIDDFNQDIYTGDIVGADVIIKPEKPSEGGNDRVTFNPFEFEENFQFFAGVNFMFGQPQFVLDNHSVPLSWATRIKVVGNIFYEMDESGWEINIQSRCAQFAQFRGDRKFELELASYAPFYGQLDWKKVVLRQLGVDED